MKINLHKNARTTPAQRAFIQNDTQMNISHLALKIGVSETTIRRWKKRSFVFDKPHTPKKIATALTPFEELIVILIRLSLRSGLDDLQQIVRSFIQPNCSRSSLNRCLKRYHISRLTPLHKGVPFSLNDYQGTFLYYSKIQFPCWPDKSPGFCIQTLLDTSFRMLHAQVCSSLQVPPLHFIKKGMHQHPLQILGIIFSDPILLSDTNTDLLESNKRHSRLIQNLCKIQGLKYHKKTLPFETTGTLKNTYADIGSHCHVSPPDKIRLRTVDLMKNISFYNTQLCQRTLKQKTPEQALAEHYSHFPSSFNQCPTQSSGTWQPTKNCQ